MQLKQDIYKVKHIINSCSYVIGKCFELGVHALTYDYETIFSVESNFILYCRLRLTFLLAYIQYPLYAILIFVCM